MGEKVLRIQVTTPARLHLGLIDMNGDLGRLFGGLGVAIDRPNVIVEAEPSNHLTVSGEETDLAKTMVNLFLSTYKVDPKVHLNVAKSIPPHIGLGSGTQLSLAIASALA